MSSDLSGQQTAPTGAPEHLVPCGPIRPYPRSLCSFCGSDSPALNAFLGACVYERLVNIIFLRSGRAPRRSADDSDRAFMCGDPDRS